jgi:hypothetical protein
MSTTEDNIMERAELLQYLETHDYRISIEALRERVQLLQYLEAHDYNISIGDLRERVQLLERSDG